MAKFILAYYGQTKIPDTPEEGRAEMEKWKNWLAELGSAVITPGSPMTRSKIVTKDEVVDDDPNDTMSGYTIVEANNLNQAVKIAQSCPYVSNGGILKVAELLDMQAF